MRIAELSRQSGVPIPSIKYYLRSGLLPAGERTAPNQADYGETHLRRLKLIRALIDVGGLPIASVQEVLTALDTDARTLNDAMGMALEPAYESKRPEEASTMERARATAMRVVSEHGWQIRESSAKIELLVSAIAAMYRLGSDVDEVIDLYADMAGRMAPAEVAWAARAADVDTVAERAVIGTFIGAAIFNAMRVIVHESVSHQQFDIPTEVGSDTAAEGRP
ncbi:MAG TPA: MerR family transcriptional regulator [Stackebrandtia sp.]|uniref:MerR family transcriptional regulator n=1 Tax=Stackebrandtia sp. TaxID=2023065 RepID=UPI002D63545C|nr:MerR family transcriptional regulator [Stackebrandtia sp.]HZE37612.1 MerR family transcriptional regulator [Stackebrandtia sp.]